LTFRRLENARKLFLHSSGDTQFLAVQKLAEHAAKNFIDTGVFDHVGVDQVIPQKAAPGAGGYNGIDDRIQIRLIDWKSCTRRSGPDEKLAPKPGRTEADGITSSEGMAQFQIRGAVGSAVPRQLQNRGQIRRVELNQVCGAIRQES